MKKTKKNLKEWLRSNKGITLGEFYEKIGVHRSTSFKWRHGIAKPHPKHMSTIKKFTNGYISVPEDLVE